MRLAGTFVIAVAAAASLASPAAAVDFTFNVRVEVSDLASDVNRLTIECAACSERCQGTRDVVVGTEPWLVGYGSTTHTFAPGAPRNFNGVVRVAFDARPGEVAERARNYLCVMNVHTPLGAVGSSTFQPKPGAPHVTRLEGPIGPTVAPPGPLTPDPKGTLRGGTIPKGGPSLPK
jgi:hypothetical protein